MEEDSNRNNAVSENVVADDKNKPSQPVSLDNCCLMLLAST